MKPRQEYGIPGWRKRISPRYAYAVVGAARKGVAYSKKRKRARRGIAGRVPLCVVSWCGLVSFLPAMDYASAIVALAGTDSPALFRAVMITVMLAGWGRPLINVRWPLIRPSVAGTPELPDTIQLTR